MPRHAACFRHFWGASTFESGRCRPPRGLPSSESPTAQPSTSHPPPMVTPVATTTARDTRMVKLSGPQVGGVQERVRGARRGLSAVQGKSPGCWSARRRSVSPRNWRCRCRFRDREVVNLRGWRRRSVDLPDQLEGGPVHAPPALQQRQVGFTPSLPGDLELKIADVGGPRACPLVVFSLRAAESRAFVAAHPDLLDPSTSIRDWKTSSAPRTEGQLVSDPLNGGLHHSCNERDVHVAKNGSCPVDLADSLWAALDLVRAYNEPIFSSPRESDLVGTCLVRALGVALGAWGRLSAD